MILMPGVTMCSSISLTFSTPFVSIDSGIDEHLLTSHFTLPPCTHESREWLKEIDSEQYYECFQMNFQSRNGTPGTLSRTRLESLRLQDFPKLNIKDFTEAKKVHEHVKCVLRYEFSSPKRKQEVNQMRKKLGLSTETLPDINSQSPVKLGSR